MLSLRDRHSPKMEVGSGDFNRLAIYAGLPAGVIGIELDQPAGRGQAGFDLDPLRGIR
jgi:hypothetical protein